jgi:hypothetical protein
MILYTFFISLSISSENADDNNRIVHTWYANANLIKIIFLFFKSSQLIKLLVVMFQIQFISKIT